MVGNVAIGADGKTLIWSLGSLTASVDNRVVTHAVEPIGLGQTWKQIVFRNTAGTQVTTGNVRIVADRTDPQVFYAFGNTAIYVSRDSGDTFVQATVTASDGNNFPNVSNGDRAIRGEVGVSHIFSMWSATTFVSSFMIKRKFTEV